MRNSWKSVSSVQFPVSSTASFKRQLASSQSNCQLPSGNGNWLLSTDMKLVVCIKQVVTREWQLRVNDSRTWIRDQDASFELNEPDAYALEEALRLKEKHGGEVIVCSAGPARVAQVVREALARGADRAIHGEDDRLASADAFVTAGALASAMRDEKFDLILTGLQSDDQGFAQVGVILAEHLGLPHATIIMEVQI